MEVCHLQTCFQSHKIISRSELRLNHLKALSQSLPSLRRVDMDMDVSELDDNELDIELAVRTFFSRPSKPDLLISRQIADSGWRLRKYPERQLSSSRPVEDGSNQTASPLLHLPAEIQNAIYAFALDAAIVHVAYPSSVEMELRRRDLHLPRTCRQIARETTPYLDTFTRLVIERSDYWFASQLKDALYRQNRSLSSVQELVTRRRWIRHCFVNHEYRLRCNELYDLMRNYRELVQIVPSL